MGTPRDSKAKAGAREGEQRGMGSAGWDGEGRRRSLDGMRRTEWDGEDRAGCNAEGRTGWDRMGWHDMPTAVPSHWEFPFSNNQALLNDLDMSINVLN